MKTILDAEKATFTWREERSKNTGLAGDLEKAFKAGFNLNKWERTDHARAELLLGIAMVFELRDAAAIEKKLAKSAPATPASQKPAVPKF